MAGNNTQHFSTCNLRYILVPNTSIINVLCNNGVYTSGELEEETPAQRNYDYHNISPYPNAYAYGHATCNLNLTSSDCKTCLGAAQTAFFSTCQTPRIGARSVLYDCTIKHLSKFIHAYTVGFSRLHPKGLETSQELDASTSETHQIQQQTQSLISTCEVGYMDHSMLFGEYIFLENNSETM
ncbi:hypothetical protein HKD37_03G008020 [Glycine soja]